MPVNERLMATGDWSVTLDTYTPRSVRDAVKDPFGHVVILPQWVEVKTLSDTGMFRLARYTGVVLEPGPQLELAGYGLAWWLGNADGQGGIKTTGGHFFEADTWFAVYEEIIGPDLAMGSVTPSGGAYTESFNLVTRRAALDAVTAVNGHVWRINPDGTFDVEARNTVFPTPRVILLNGRSGRGYDSMNAVDCDIRVRRDYELWASNVDVIGQDVTYGVGVAASNYKSLTGNNVKRLLVFDGPDVPFGSTDETAAALFVKYGVDEGRRLVEVEARDQDATSLVRCGDQVFVYDPLQGLEDTGNYVFMAGEPAWPATMQVTAMSWPVLRGMGVYHRRYLEADAAPVWTDLTPYVVFEDGNATFEVVAGGDADRWNMANATGRVDQVSLAQDRRKQSPPGGYTPTWTNGTVNPSIGATVLHGSFRREGTLLWARGSATMPGATLSVGSGDMRLSIPTGMTFASSGAVQVGSAYWYDSSVPAVIRGNVLAEPGAAYVNFIFGDATLRFDAASLGFNDVVSFQLTAEVTP